MEGCTKSATRRLVPVVEPGQKIVLSDAFASKTKDDFPNREFGDPLCFRALEDAALARDLKQFLKASLRSSPLHNRVRTGRRSGTLTIRRTTIDRHGLTSRGSRKVWLTVEPDEVFMHVDRKNALGKLLFTFEERFASAIAEARSQRKQHAQSCAWLVTDAFMPARLGTRRMRSKAEVPCSFSI